jgi:hypothetical protein
VMAYIVLGLAEEILFFKSRRQAAREAKADAKRTVPAGPPEEEVLRELGAYETSSQER